MAFVIDGRSLADSILSAIKARSDALKAKGINPRLDVILVGDDPGSQSYVRQKEKAGTATGITVVVHRKPADFPSSDLEALIRSLNADPAVHGLIIQRPLPDMGPQFARLLDTVDPEKDVDGFLPGSTFPVPVASAVGKILKFTVSHIAKWIDMDNISQESAFSAWMKNRPVAIIGRGATAGKPIGEYLQHMHCATSVIHSHTPDPGAVMRSADVIISCVGKKDIVSGKNVKPGAILISVGIWRDGNGKLHGDYDPSDIEAVAAAYTPTPGGVGPVNVACLMENALAAARRHSGIAV